MRLHITKTVAVILVFCCLMNLTIYINAKDSIHIGIQNIQNDAESKIYASIYIDNNPGIWGIDIKVGYPADVIQVESVQNGAVFSDAELTEPKLENNPIVLSFENSGFDNTEKNGVLATIVFNVLQNAKSGTYLIKLSCSDGDVIDSNAYEIPFVLKNGTITINADKEWNNPFIDVSDRDTFYDAVRYVYENCLFIGVSDNQFAPHLTMTRAMFVTVLGRLAKVDQKRYTGTTFKDVKTGEWYSSYVEWAAENGIVNGYGNGNFGVNDEVTVEQAVAIIARYARYIGINTSCVALGEFKDSTAISAWAVSDMAWIVESGIYTGKEGKLLPRTYAERAFVATMLYKFISLIG